MIDTIWCCVVCSASQFVSDWKYAIKYALSMGLDVYKYARKEISGKRKMNKKYGEKMKNTKCSILNMNPVVLPAEPNYKLKRR